MSILGTNLTEKHIRSMRKDWIDAYNYIEVKLDFLYWSFQQLGCNFGMPRCVVQGENSVKMYVAQFEGWKSVARAKNLGISEREFVNIFIYGLRTEMKTKMPIWTPQTLAHAIILAEIHEEFLEKQAKKSDKWGLQLENKIVPENGLITPSNDKSSVSNSEEIYDYLGLKLGEELAPENEVFVKGFSHEEIDLPRDDKSEINFSAKKSPSEDYVANNCIKKEQDSDQFSLELISDGVQKKQEMQKVSLVEDSIKKFEPSCVDSEEGHASLCNHKEILWLLDPKGESLYHAEVFGLRIQKGSEHSSSCGVKLGVVRCIATDEWKIIKKSFILSKIVVWFRGPDPGGTYWGPFLLLSPFFILEDKDVFMEREFVMNWEEISWQWVA